jgi:hypothetical protein
MHALLVSLFLVLSVAVSAPTPDEPCRNLCDVFVNTNWNACTDVPAIEIDYSSATSGQCYECVATNNCTGSVGVTVNPTGGTYVQGLVSCSGGGDSVTVQLIGCGSNSHLQADIHTGFPCTPSNRQCYGSVTVGCRRCD